MTDPHAVEILRRTYADHEHLAAPGAEMDVMRRARQTSSLHHVQDDPPAARRRRWRMRPLFAGAAAAVVLLATVLAGVFLLADDADQQVPATSQRLLSTQESSALLDRVDGAIRQAGTLRLVLAPQREPQQIPGAPPGVVSTFSAIVAEQDLRDTRPRVRIGTRDAQGRETTRLVTIGDDNWSLRPTQEEESVTWVKETVEAPPWEPLWFVQPAEPQATWLLGAEIVDGVTVEHYMFVSDLGSTEVPSPTPPASPAGPRQSTQLWVAKDTGRLVRMETVDETEDDQVLRSEEITYGLDLTITPPDSDRQEPLDQ